MKTVLGHCPINTLTKKESKIQENISLTFTSETMFVQAPDEVTAFVAPRGIGQLL